MTREAEQLAVDHRQLAEAIAEKFLRGVPAHVDADALRGAAMEALVTGAARFDARFGSVFSRWVSARIWYAMQDELRRLSPHTRGEFAALRAGETSRTVRRRGPRCGEAVEVEVPVRKEISLATPVGEEDTGSLEEILGDPRDQYAGVDEWIDYERAAADLSERERVVVEALGAGWTGDEVAELLGVSGSRVSQIRGRALELLAEAGCA